MISPHMKRNIEAISAYSILLIALFLAVFPTFWILSTSLKTREDIFAMPPRWIFTPVLENFKNVLTGFPFLKFLKNSLIVSAANTVLALAIGCPAAYSFSRFKFRGSKDLAFWILSLRMAPSIAFVLPIYILFSKLGLLDTQLSLILAYFTYTLPIVIWVMMGFFKGIPAELEEAALVDGSSRLGAFFRITLPLSLSGIWTTAFLCFVFCWNEFLYALILTGVNARTVAVAVSAFNTQRGILWGEMGAASVIAIVPVLALSTFIHKHYIKGLALGAIKR